MDAVVIEGNSGCDVRFVRNGNYVCEPRGMDIRQTVSMFMVNAGRLITQQVRNSWRELLC